MLPSVSESLFDPKLPVRDLLRRFPHLASALAASGIDQCCGGEHSLEEACDAKGVRLEELLGDLESAHRTAESYNLVPPTLSVRDVRRRFPSTIPVFEAHGLGDCGGEEGPDEPLAWFATVHRLDLEEFLRQIRQAAVADAARQPRSIPTASAAAPFSPHFILGSLLLTLTLGATAGMVNLLRISAGAEVPISHRQIHGHTQLLGFAALFLMGISYHALPRILGISGISARSARAAFWLLFSGVVLRNAGQPLGFYPIGRILSLVSAGLEVASVLLFSGFVFALLRRVQPGKYDRSDPILSFVRIGTFSLLAAAGFIAAQGIWLAGHVETATPVALTEPFYFALLYGFLLAWIYGFGNRVVSLFLGVGPARRGTPQITMALQAISVPLFLASYLPSLPLRSGLALRDAGMGAAALSALVFLAGHGLVWRKTAFPTLSTPGSPTFAIRAAFANLALWAILELTAIGLTRMTRFPAQNLWWADAARHVFGVGFLTLLIVGMSFRILPVFSGKRLWSPGLAYATYGLLLAATFLRLLQYPAAFAPAFYRAGSFMGILVVAALLLFAVNLFRTMRSKRPMPAERRDPPAYSSTLPVRD